MTDALKLAKILVADTIEIPKIILHLRKGRRTKRVQARVKSVRRTEDSLYYKMDSISLKKKWRCETMEVQFEDVTVKKPMPTSLGPADLCSYYSLDLK